MATETDIDRRLDRLENAASATGNNIYRPVKLAPWQQQIADRQEDERRRRVDQLERARIAREADYAADAPRRAKVQGTLDELDRQIQVAEANVLSLQHRYGELRRTL
ncbi:MAG: hypothetical protein WBW80_23095 [Acidimicrobiales bacterium]